jgi:para-nitrobenzyl esterase
VAAELVIDLNSNKTNQRGYIMQVIKTDNGYVSGTIIGETGNEVSIFRGIPYAAAPLGELRWKPPQPAAPWEGIRECTQYSAISPQPSPPGMAEPFPMSEDCLYLNVVTPAKKAKEKLPVMVWMHGGGYFMGCGNDKIWNQHCLPLFGVVVVTITHRLGPIGLVAHPALSEESPNNVSGNYLFLDLIAALKWVQKNIASFGGDPNNVTIFGESGGGAKVSIMMTSPLAKGLFHRAICESGTATAISPGVPLAKMEENGKILFEKLGAKTLAEARKVPWEKIIEASETMAIQDKHAASLKLPPWDSAIDSWLLPDSPENILKSGRFNAVPLIVMSTLGELTGPGPLVMPFIIPAYIGMIDAVNKNGRKGYACIFDQVPDNWRQDGCVSAHSMELTYVFGDWDNSSGWWQSIGMIAKMSGAKTETPALDAIDRKVSEAMMGYWTGFARTGKPQAKGLPEWPEYSRTTDRYMYLNLKPTVRTGFSKLEHPTSQ